MTKFERLTLFIAVAMLILTAATFGLAAYQFTTPSAAVSHTPVEMGSNGSS